MLLQNIRKSIPASKLNRFRGVFGLLIAILSLSFSAANAQQLTATLSGTVTDQSDARIAGAAITITGDTTGDVRRTKAGSDGFFSVTALVPGTYTLTIKVPNFAEWKESGILLNQGDSRTVPNIHLKVSADPTAVTVISGADAEVPVDNAEVSFTLNNDLVDSATLTTRNAAELIKMMPGVAFNNSGGAGSGFATSGTTGTNSGPAGSFSANGTQPYGSTSIILDGANLIDPGNAGTQIANINQDMTDSVKFLSASYGAEYAKGPAVFQAFSKSGTQKFHGEGYLYARDAGAGYSNDAFAKAQGNPLYPSYFYYMGGNLGGPIFFPGFNKNRDKLFFWGGYEYNIQHPYNNPVEMNVPTADQTNGDFNNAGLPVQVTQQVYPQAYQLPCATDDGWQGCGPTNSPWGGYGSGTVPNLKQYFDPSGAVINGLNPAPNQTPSANNGYNNFGYSPNTPVNRWEATGKVNYSFNDNNKLWGSYAYQSETDGHPLAIWWAPEWTIPYPAGASGKETAQVYLANFTHVFNPATTNEFVFSYAKFVNDNALTNPSAVSRAKLGFPVGSIFGTANPTDQIPNFTGGWNSGLTEINEFDFNSGIYGKNTFGKTSKAPAITDTFTRIIKTHSIKAGFYWDTFENLQANGSDVNGNFDFETWGASSTYNLTLDRLMARPEHYDEQNTDPVPDITQHEWSIWAQDSWKVSPKLTLNLGLRADHEGQWYDKIGGTQVWDPASYDNSSTPPANTGLLWHKISSKIPTSGWKSQLFFYDPRIGVAYDIFGTGKTVIRGGFGSFRYQVSSNDASGAMGGPLGSYDYSTGNGASNGFYGYQVTGATLFTNNAHTQTTTVKVPVGLNQNGVSGLKADQEGDNRVPYANTYSFGIAQALPGHTVAEVSYVGSASRNQLLNGANGHIQDANPTAYGAYFKPDPITGVLVNPSPVSGTSTLNAQDYRPLHNYGDIYIQTHGGYANYNSLQVSAQKQSGNLFLFTNFTFGKVLGTRDGSTSNGNGNGSVINPFNLAANYGPLGYDHTKIFNVSFNYKLPSLVHNNWVVGEAVNGWQISGYTTYQDGSPYQSNSPNMNANYQQLKDGSGKVLQTFTMPDGLMTQAISTSTWFGTNQYENGIQPLLTCDPRKGLKTGQYFNPNCFAAPHPPTATSFGEEGQTIWPYIRNPHYVGSDMAVFKAFRVTDSQRFEVRISMTNWLNHPNAQFGLAGNSDNELTFNGVSDNATLVRNSNESTTGIPQNKIGYRWTQFAAKYYF